MRSVVLYCPHLGRDLRGLHEVVPELLIYTGLPTERGEDGCLQGHQEIVAEAGALGESRVFVMEDDCKFTPNFSFSRWCENADWAQEHGYDVMVGGCTRTYDERIAGEQYEEFKSTPCHRSEYALRHLTTFIEVSAFHSAHCIVYFQSVYDKLVHAVQPFDLSLGRNCGARCVLVHPFVAVQQASFSGILQQNVDYVPLYEQHERNLQRGLRL